MRKILKTLNNADLARAYARSQGQDDKISTYASLSKEVGSKLQTPSSNPPPPLLSGSDIDKLETVSTVSGLILRNQSI